MRKDELKTAACMGRREPSWSRLMQDVVYNAITVLFFAMAIGYVRFCDRVK